MGTLSDNLVHIETPMLENAAVPCITDAKRHIHGVALYTLCRGMDDYS